MASGLPVLVSRACGCAELVSENRNGFTFDSLRVGDLAAAMERLWTSPHLPQMRVASQEIIARWSPDFFAENLQRAYQVAQSCRPPRGRWLARALLFALSRRQMAANV